jgi:hypothetical protein
LRSRCGRFPRYRASRLGQVLRTESLRSTSGGNMHVVLEANRARSSISKTSAQIIPLKGRIDFATAGGDSLWSCGAGETYSGLSAGSQPGSRAGAWSLKRIADFTRISADPETIRRRQVEQHDCALCAGLLSPTERVWWSQTASLTAPLSPASALRPPRGLGGGGAILRRRD